MRLEATANEDEYKVWLTDDELEEFRRAAATHRDNQIIQLGGYVCLRAFDIPQIKPKHVILTEDGEHYRLSVPKGKDTTRNGRKPRDAYLPQAVEGDIHPTTTPKTSDGMIRSSTSLSAVPNSTPRDHPLALG